MEFLFLALGILCIVLTALPIYMIVIGAGALIFKIYENMSQSFWSFERAVNYVVWPTIVVIILIVAAVFLFKLFKKKRAAKKLVLKQEEAKEEIENKQ